MIIVGIVILLLDYLYYRFYLSNWKTRLGNSIGIQEINFNNNNKNTLKTLMTNFLNERVKLLDNMSYTDWIDYNNKNILMEFEGRKYYSFIYEKDMDFDNKNIQSNFILRASYQKELLNLDFQDETKQVNHRYIVLGQFPTNPELINSMYYMDEIINGCNLIDYFWEDPFYKRAVQKTAFFKRFSKKFDQSTTISGVIGIGYSSEDLDYNYSDIYLNYVGIPFFILNFIIIFLLSILIFYCSNKNKKFYFVKPIAMLVVLNLFLVNQLSTIGTLTDIDLEQSRMKEITSSTLGISFLVAVNIFVIQSIGRKKGVLYSQLYSENIFVFSLSLIFLLFSMYKDSNYTEIEGLRVKRIQNQIFFNLSILLNFMVLINYLFFITKRENVIRL